MCNGKKQNARRSLRERRRRWRGDVIRVIRRRESLWLKVMRFRFQFRRYRLPLRAPVRTAHETWTEREGIIVRLETQSDGQSRIGFGEAAPIPAFGTETVDEIEATARTLSEWIEDEQLAAVPVQLGCLRSALSAALTDASGTVDTSAPQEESTARTLGVAALVPAGRAALAAIPVKAEIGFRVFKWKVGVADLADEIALLDDVCGSLPSGGKLRLDANGAWDRRQAERWLERCADRPVEFVEQPCFAPAKDTRAAGRVDDILRGLAADYPTPIALDESLVADGDVERWLGSGWPGIFVLKPSLLGDAPRTIARLTAAKADVVFSSALETAIGARTALRHAFAWADQIGDNDSVRRRAIGFGVWPLFADGRFDAPAAAPFIRRGDLNRLNPETLWTALI
jgi:o-succinylbenzoate synthase